MAMAHTHMLKQLNDTQIDDDRLYRKWCTELSVVIDSDYEFNDLDDCSEGHTAAAEGLGAT